MVVRAVCWGMSMGYVGGVFGSSSQGGGDVQIYRFLHWFLWWVWGKLSADVYVDKMYGKHMS